MTSPRIGVTPLTVPALLVDRVRASGRDTYLITPTGRLTYEQADAQSADIARRLLGAGIGKGVRVGLFFPNGIEWIIWWLALARIGALVVPLSTLYAPAEIAKVLRLADIAMLIAPAAVLGTETGTRLEAALPELPQQRRDELSLACAPYLRRIVLTDDVDYRWATRWADLTRQVSPDVLAAVEQEVSPADLAIMVHTSGSTADPKGVLHTHGTLVRQTSMWPSAIRAVTASPGRPKVLCAMPFFWIGGLLAAMGALHDSISLLVMERLDATTALDLIETERGTGIVGWPAFTQRLRDHPRFAERDLSSAPMLRHGPLDIAMTDVPGGFPVHRTMSETAGGFVCTDIAIVDEHGTPVPDGTTGELWIRGVGTMAGYNKRERSEVFDADGWYHTGDRVYRRADDPRLFYVGRTTDMIKAGGANVSPVEVESVIAGLPQVTQCVVIGIEHADRGQEVCAVVVPAQAPLDLGAVREAAREHLSAYKVPTRWVIATADQIPTLSSGKFDRKTLLANVIAGTLAISPTAP